jgi:hypothetical protein
MVDKPHGPLTFYLARWWTTNAPITNNAILNEDKDDGAAISPCDNAALPAPSTIGNDFQKLHQEARHK